MAISFLTASESHTGTTGSTNAASFTFPHASSGTPKGVVVFVHQHTTVTDYCTGVTYGGTAMTSLGTIVTDAAGELGSAKAYFLGASVPTGTQDVVVSRTNNATVMYASCMTFGADGNTTSTAGYTTQGGDVSAWTGLSVNDGSPGSNSVRVMGLYTGANTPPTAGTGTTRPTAIDFGNYGCAMFYQTTPSQGSFTVATSSVTDDMAAIAFAVIDSINDLLAQDLESATNVSQPVIGQTHALLAQDLESVSNVSTPTAANLAGSHDLLAQDLQSATSVSTPVMGVIRNLLAQDLQSATSVSTPVVGQKHNLLAQDLQSATSVSTPVLGVIWQAPTITSINPTTGVFAGGTAVTITGTGFQAGATVKFDGVLATSVVVVNDTTITCVTPAF
jgi:IPT/TIG domain